MVNQRYAYIYIYIYACAISCWQYACNSFISGITLLLTKLGTGERNFNASRTGKQPCALNLAIISKQCRQIYW